MLLSRSEWEKQESVNTTDLGISRFFYNYNSTFVSSPGCEIFYSVDPASDLHVGHVSSQEHSMEIFTNLRHQEDGPPGGGTEVTHSTNMAEVLGSHTGTSLGTQAQVQVTQVPETGVDCSLGTLSGASLSL